MKNMQLNPNLLLSLKGIINVLNRFGHYDQTNFLIGLVDDLEKGNGDIYEKINSAALWGGSGSVWEVEITDQSAQVELNQQVLNLLRQMQNDGMLGTRARTVLKLLLRND